MAYPKFIITSDGHLRLGMVTLHRHLLNHYAMQMELSGASSDYGKPQWHRIDKVILPRDFQGYTFTWLINGKQHPLTEMLPVVFE